MANSTNFFERIMQIIDYKGFKSVNEFSIHGLKYKSSEKINRLKNTDKQPSVDILIDISNMFEEINSSWLLTGKGSMLIVEEKNTNLDANQELLELHRENRDLRIKIEELKTEIAELRKQPPHNKSAAKLDPRQHQLAELKHK